MFLGLVLTARHSMEDIYIGSSSSNMGDHGRNIDWAEVVTRYPQENLRMDHLFLSFLFFLLYSSSGVLVIYRTIVH
jgi:hypothetical protein